MQRPLSSHGAGHRSRSRGPPPPPPARARPRIARSLGDGGSGAGGGGGGRAVAAVAQPRRPAVVPVDAARGSSLDEVSGGDNQARAAPPSVAAGPRGSGAGSGAGSGQPRAPPAAAPPGLLPSLWGALLEAGAQRAGSAFREATDAAAALAAKLQRYVEPPPPGERVAAGCDRVGCSGRVWGLGEMARTRPRERP
jgi:hypothetical protein